MKRCSWVKENNEVYVKYHDEEWGRESHDDSHLFEMLILESFQAGLSWECILNKRENFRKAFDQFDRKKIANYDEKKIEELKKDSGIIRNEKKIIAAIQNAKVFQEIEKEFGTFSNYLWSYTNNTQIINNKQQTTSPLSDQISKDLQKRGMKFVGSTIIYSYLQAVGVINDHERECFLKKRTKK